MTEIDNTVARINASIDRASKKKLRDEFRNLNLKLISKKSKKDLIDWLTEYPVDSPQYVWGQQELSKKLLRLWDK